MKTPAKQAEYQLDLSGLINDPDFEGGTISVNGVGIEYKKGMSADDVYNQMISVADEIGCKFEKDPIRQGFIRLLRITGDQKKH